MQQPYMTLLAALCYGIVVIIAEAKGKDDFAFGNDAIATLGTSISAVARCAVDLGNDTAA